MKQAEKHYFLPVTDSLSKQINDKANELFHLLNNFDASNLAIDDTYKNYFINHHLGRRLFFSVQNSAHILYQSVKRTGKPIEEINIVDYGAGLGTLYMLGGMLNFKCLVYNDYLPDWKNTAQSICEALGITVTAYITGDIAEVTQYATEQGFKFDIIASRNVIEHIYNLPSFYKDAYQHNPLTLIFSTTSANFHNPVMRLKHYLLHKKVERNIYSKQRKEFIQKNWATVAPDQLTELIIKTRGKAKQDMFNAINSYQNKIAIEPVPFLRSNTCDCINGLWHEHLLTKAEYELIINSAGYRMEFSAGYWDTHYKSRLMNSIAGILNKMIILFGKKGYILSPFVNIIAYN